MSRSLPEMGAWDSVFDETYLETYLPSVDPERTRAEALGAASLAQLEPRAEVLDSPKRTSSVRGTASRRSVRTRGAS